MPRRIVPNTCTTGHPVLSVLGFIFIVTFIGIRSPPWSLPIPPRRRALCPLLISVRVRGRLQGFFFFLFQLLQGWQCLFEVRSVRRSHSIETLLVRMKPPITLVERVFLWCQMVGMVFIRESVPCSAKFFVSMILNHSISEFWISYESNMDALEQLLLALFLQLVGRMVFLVSRLFSISMSVRSPFLDNVLRNWKKVHRVIDELLICTTFFVQEVLARAIKDANVPVW